MPTNPFQTLPAQAKAIEAKLKQAEADREVVQLFLTDLAELAKEHGITIYGCGCCGSPSLELAHKPIIGRYEVSSDFDCLSFKKLET